MGCGGETGTFSTEGEGGVSCMSKPGCGSSAGGASGEGLWFVCPTRAELSRRRTHSAISGTVGSVPCKAPKTASLCSGVAPAMSDANSWFCRVARSIALSSSAWSAPVGLISSALI